MTDAVVLEQVEPVFGMDQWLEFAARLHPVVLHLPIGLLAAGLILEFVTLFSRGAVPARRTMHTALAISAIVAALTGWLLADGGGYSGALVDDHRKIGIAAAVVALLLALTDLFGRSGTAALVRRLLVLACAAAIGLAGHHGGMITHGRTFLSEKAPPWLAPYLGVPRRKSAPRTAPAVDVAAPDGLTSTEPTVGGGTGGSAAASAPEPEPESPSDFALLFAAFQERCFECHNEDKTKGDMRLDQLSGWTDGVDLESPEDSELLYRVLLPRDDADAMPPKGEALDPAAIEALERWIESGAPTEELESMLGVAVEIEQQASADLDGVRRDTGARIAAIALDLGAPAASQRLEVTWRHTDTGPSQQNLAALEPIAARIVDLDVARPDTADAVLEALPDLPALERIHLETTQVTDSGLVALRRIAPALRYVNLHSTAVSGQGLTALAGLEGLERVVLFGTAVDASDVAAFATLRPGVKVTVDDGFAGDSPFGARQPRRILAADASKKRVALLREIAIGRPEVLWERPIEALHDLQWLGETAGGHGRVLVQESWTRIVEVDTATNETLWSYDAATGGDGPVEIHSFRRLEDGSTMVAESGRRRLAFVDAAGQVTDEIPLVVDAPDPHHDTRLVRPTAAGTFLVAHENDGVVREYDREGGVVWSFDVPLFDRERVSGHGPEAHGNQVFAAVRRADGDTLVTTGNGSSLLCVRPDKTVRWRLTGADMDGVGLAWVTTVQELANGDLVLGNCHAGPDQPQAIQLRPDHQVEWRFLDFERFGDGLSNLVVIEEAR